MAQPQVRQLLHQNLNVETYRIKSANTHFGIQHQKHSIIIEENTNIVYLALVLIQPYNTLQYYIDRGEMKVVGETTGNVLKYQAYADAGVMDVEKTIIFPSAFATTNIVITASVIDANGYSGGYVLKPSDITKTQFKITPMITGTIYWTAAEVTVIPAP